MVDLLSGGLVQPYFLLLEFPLMSNNRSSIYDRRLVLSRGMERIIEINFVYNRPCARQKISMRLKTGALLKTPWPLDIVSFFEMLCGISAETMCILQYLACMGGKGREWTLVGDFLCIFLNHKCRKYIHVA